MANKKKQMSPGETDGFNGICRWKSATEQASGMMAARQETPEEPETTCGEFNVANTCGPVKHQTWHQFPPWNRISVSTFHLSLESTRARGGQHAAANSHSGPRPCAQEAQQQGQDLAALFQGAPFHKGPGYVQSKSDYIKPKIPCRPLFALTSIHRARHAIRVTAIASLREPFRCTATNAILLRLNVIPGQSCKRPPRPKHRIRPVNPFQAASQIGIPPQCLCR